MWLQDHTTIIYVILLFTLVVGVGVVSASTATAQSGLDLTEGSDIALEDLEVTAEPSSFSSNDNGQIQYNVSVSGKVATDGLPLLYPVRLSFYDVTDYSGSYDRDDLESSSDVNTLETTTTILNPTKPKSFVPTITDSGGEERLMSRELSTGIAFNDMLGVSSEDKDVVIIAESTRSPNQHTIEKEHQIDGPLPEGISSSVVQESEDINILSDVSFVDSFRISPQDENPQFSENMGLPDPSDDELSGQLQKFSEMRSPFGDSAVASGDDELSFITQTESIPTGRPYTVLISYDISEGSNVSVNPINPIGQQIQAGTEYQLPSDPDSQENCREIDAGSGTTNLCTMYLSQEEVEQVGSISELLLHYKSDESTTISLMCQSVVSGYLPQDEAACGVDPANTETQDPVASVTLDTQGQPGSIESGQWSSSPISIVSNIDESVDHNIRYDVRESIADSVDDGEYEVRIYKESDHVGSSGEIISSATPIHQQDISDYQEDSWIEVTDSSNPNDNLPETYHVILCRSGTAVPSECGIETNTYHDEIQFTAPTIPDAEINIRSPVVINTLAIDQVEEDANEVRTELLETPDPNYGTENPNVAWDSTNGGDPVIEDFEGTVRQEVTVPYVFESDKNTAQNGEILPEAEEKLSDLGVPIDDLDYDVSVSRVESKELHIPATEDIGDYSYYSIGWYDQDYSPRTVQTGKTQENFPIVSSESFGARVEGQERWYPLRGTDADRTSTEFVFDTRLQRTDPDNCLNCLPTETVSDAEARIADSQGGAEGVAGTGGFNAWVLSNSEPTLRSGEENSFSFFRRSSPSGRTISYENIGLSGDNRFKYRHRESNKETIELQQWEFSPQIVEPLFEKPVTEQLSRYTRHRYDVTYEFEGELSTPTDIYRYERDVVRDAVEYEDGHVAWVDVSQSEPADQIQQFEVRFEGAEQPIPVDWVEDIHSVPPGERDDAISNYCSDEPEYDTSSDYPVSLGLSQNQIDNLEYKDSGPYQGIGGTPVIQKCEVDGEEQIVRIGQEYTEPGLFSYDVELSRASQAESGVVEVIPEQQDDEIPPDTATGGEPTISNIELINDKIDYQIGTVPIDGEISSQTHHLDEEYEVTVTPADNIDSSAVSCSELGGSYRSVMNKTLTDSYPSGASFREVERCIASAYDDPNQLPDQFDLRRIDINYEQNTIGDFSAQVPIIENIEAYDIPAGAIQRCEPPLEEDSDGNCIAPSSLDGLSSDNPVSFQNSDGTYQEVEKFNSTTPALGTQCPHGYELNETSIDSEYDDSFVESCQLENPEAVSIELRSRTVSYQFQSVGSSDLVETCGRIPTVGEDGNHAGYQDIGGTDTEECALIDSNDEGPVQFTLSEQDVNPVTGDEFTSYNDIPAGAFRAKSFITGNIGDRCDEVNIEDDGAMICEYDHDGDDFYREIRFGTRTQGQWTSASDSASNLIDQSNSRKAVWQGDVVAPDGSGNEFDRNYKEDFTTTIDPRGAGISLDQGTVEFTIELREKYLDNVIESETVEVQLCSAGSIDERSDLPRGEQGQYECDNFDTMMTGSDDFQGETSIQDALQDYEANHLDGTEQEYVIDAAANDACPYTAEFPRNQTSLVDNAESYTVNIQASDTNELYDDQNSEESRIKEQIRSSLVGQYSPLGPDPCERVEDPLSEIPTFVDDPSFFELEFNKQEFLNSNPDSDRRNVRLAGIEDLKQITQNPVQSRWTKDDMGSAIRLGTPILLDNSGSIAAGETNAEKNDVNEHLVAHYTFDHDPTDDVQFTDLSEAKKNGNTVSLSTTNNHYVIQDVGMMETAMAPDGREADHNFDYTDESPGIYNARLWYGSPCHTGSTDGDISGSGDGDDNGRISHPTAVQPLENSNIGPSQNPQAFSGEPCENMLNSNQATQIAEQGYVENGKPTYENDDLNGQVPDDQSAFLPVPPEEDWESEYSNNGNTIENSDEAIEDNYAQQKGVYGGNALRLDDTSWMMVTPPCTDKPSIGEDLDDVGETIDQSACDPGNPLEEDDWAGGFKDAYTNYEQQTGGDTIHSEIDDEYTVSFWVNTKSEENSMSEVTHTDGSSVAPLRSVYSTSATIPPGQSVFDNPSPHILTSSMELNLVKAPEYISLDGIDNSQIDNRNGQRASPPYGPNAWDYPAHYNLMDTARACMSHGYSHSELFSPVGGAPFIPFSLPQDKRPVMCEIFEHSDSEVASSESQYDDLTSYDPNILSASLYEPPFLNDFREEIIDRTVYENRLDWPAGYAIQRDAPQQLYPSFDQTHVGEYDQSGSPDECYFATQRETYDSSSTAKCYNDGRYLFGDDSTQLPTEDTYADSEWQHVAIRYERGNSATSDDPSIQDLQVFINGERRSNLGIEYLKVDGDAGGNVRLGKLYEDSVMSIGAVFQEPEYNFDPNHLGENSVENTVGDFVPYIHASEGDILIDEMRIHKRALTPEEIQSNEIIEFRPPEEHNFNVSEPMTQGGINTNKIELDANGQEIQDVLNQDDYRTFEVNVDASSDGEGAYVVRMIPCTDSTCYEDSSIRVEESVVNGERLVSSGLSEQGQRGVFHSIGPAYQTSEYDDTSGIPELSGVNEVVRFPANRISDSEMDSITSFKLRVRVGSPNVDSTPIVRDITLEPAGNPFESCQDIINNHPGSQGLYGSEFDATILDSSGTATKANCDMRRAGGGWTQFAWVDTSEDDSFAKDTQQSDPFFMDSMDLSDCELEDDACFSDANWNESVMQNIDESGGPYPQIMIKSVDNGGVVEWSAFQISEKAHSVYEPQYGVDTIEHAETMAQIFTGGETEVVGSGPFDQAGQDTSEYNLTVDGADNDGLYPQCLHPFDNSGSFDGGCISHLKSTNPTLSSSETGTTRVSMAEMAVQIDDSTGDITEEYKDYNNRILDIRRNDDDNTIDSIKCLGENVERCEFYYRIGNDFSPATAENGLSDSEGVFDLNNHVLEPDQPEEIDATWARGYTFEPIAPTEVESLYSATSQDTDNSEWWIALYEMDGNTVDNLIHAETAGSGSFVNNSIPPTDQPVIQNGTKYAIIQGTNNLDNGNMSGYNAPGASISVSSIMSESPIRYLGPTEQGRSFVFSNSGVNPNGIIGESVDPNTENPAELKVPRVGFEYDVLTEGVPDTQPTSEVLYLTEDGAWDGNRVGELNNVDDTTLDYIQSHDADTVSLRPDGTGEGFYVARTNGEIYHANYDEQEVGRDGNVFDPNEDGTLAVDTGLSGITQLEIGDNNQTAYIREGDKIASYNLRTGNQNWEYSFVDSNDFAPIDMVIGDDHVYAANGPGLIVEVEKGTGDENTTQVVIPESSGGSDAVITGFGVSEQSGKIVYIDGDESPKMLTIEEFRNGDSPSDLQNIIGQGITQVDEADVEVAESGHFVVSVIDESPDGSDTMHAIATYGPDNNKETDDGGYYTSSTELAYENQLIDKIDIQSDGERFAADVGTAVRTYDTTTQNVVDTRGVGVIDTFDLFLRP